jgi:cytochrome b subunit of formate dehydrogenase
METINQGAVRRPLRIEWLLSRSDNVAAWLSAAVLFLYVMSGYGLTKPESVARLTAGIMTPDLAYAIHNHLYIPLLVVFVFHTFMGLRRALIRTTRRKVIAGWIAAGSGALALAYLALLGWA